MAQFRDLDVLNSDVRKRLTPYIEWHAAELARAEFLARLRGAAAGLYTAVPLGLLVIWLAPALADLCLVKSTFVVKPKLLPNRLAGSTPGTVFCAIVFCAIVVWACSRDLNKPAAKGALIASVVMQLGAATIIARFVLLRITHKNLAMASEGAWRLLSLAIMALGVTWAIGLAYRTANRALRPLAAEIQTEIACSVAVRELIAVASAIPWSESEWANPKTRRAILTRLDMVAQAFDPHVSSFFACRHPSLHAWVGRRCAEISASIQEMAHLAFAPGPGARDEFRTRIVTLLEHCVDGTWAQLPRMPAGAPAVPKRSATMGTTLRRMIIVLTPALLLGCYYAVSSQLPGRIPPISSSALLSAAVLCITGLINVLNPQVGMDLSLAKSVSELLRARDQ